MQRKIIKIEIKPDNEQKTLIEREIKCSRFVYNYLVKKRYETWKDKKENISFEQEKEILKKLKKENGWLKNVENATLEQAIRDLDSDYYRFFKLNGDYPKYRKKNDENQWYKTKNINNNIKLHKKQKFITLPLLDLVKIETDEKLTGKVEYVKINKKDDKYEATLTIQR